MSNTFDFNRFGRLVKYDFNNMIHTGLQFMLMGAEGIAGLWILSIVFGTALPVALRFFTICALTYLALIMNTSFLYGKVNLPKRGIPFAMLPASKCEKYWSMMLYTLIVVPVCCFAGGFVIDTLLALLPIGGFEHTIWHDTPSLDGIFDMDNAEVTGALATFILVFISSFLNNHAQFFFTNTIFNRHKILLTFLVLWGIGVIISSIGTPIMMWLDINNDNWLNKWFFDMASSNPDQALNLVFAIGIGINLAMALGLYTWSYFRIKKAKY